MRSGKYFPFGESRQERDSCNEWNIFALLESRYVQKIPQMRTKAPGIPIPDRPRWFGVNIAI
jgi:hypothetical protein